MRVKFNYCSICAHKEGCPLMAFAYYKRKKACLFIPVVHLAPVGRLELQELRRAESKLITDLVLHGLQNDRTQNPAIYEPCAPIEVYKHTFTFPQLQ